MKLAVLLTVLTALLAAIAVPARSQTAWDIQPYFEQVGLTRDQINAVIHDGTAVGVSLPTRNPDEVFVFGAIWINATPEAYLRYYSDISEMRQQPNVLEVKKFSNPPVLADFEGFDLDSQAVQSLKSCAPGKCEVQLPGQVIEKLRSQIDWSAPNLDESVNRFLHKEALQYLQSYLSGGSEALGAAYDDQGRPVSIRQAFDYLLSYKQMFPAQPTLYKYLVSFPAGRPAGTGTWLYWDRVSFGLKPTLRMVQVFTMKGTTPSEPALTIAAKQLYATHYFETALSLGFCFSSSGNPQKPGMYVVVLLGSEQLGLTGFEGSMLRHIAVDRSVSGLETSLTQLKAALERK